MTRRSAHRRASRAAKLPLYASDLRPVRGRCLKRGCDSRWAVVRVTLDYTAERVEAIAALECAACGRRWRRVKVPPIASPAGYQTVRLDLILPAVSRRWFARGRWHREGDDSIVARDATIADLDTAAREHRARYGRVAASRARAAERKAATADVPDSPAHRAHVARLAALAEREAERAADERAAAEREG